MLVGYLHGEGFRKFLSAEVSRAAGVRGDFSPFRWDGLAVDADRFTATGEGPVVSLAGEGLHTEAGFGGVDRGVWELKGSRVRRLEVVVDGTLPRVPEAPPEIRVPETRQERPRRWYPDEVEIGSLEIGRIDVTARLEEGDVRAEGLAASLVRERAGGYRGEITGGAVRLPWGILPELEVGKIRARYQDRVLFITSATAKVWGDGVLNAAGEWDADRRTIIMEGDVSGIDCTRLLEKDWARRIEGTLSSTFVADGTTSSPEVRGSLGISGASLTALPVLDALAAYADTRRFRRLEFGEVRADWVWRRGGITLRNMLLAGDGIRLEGEVRISGKKLDGVLHLGLAPHLLAGIPGAERHVFIPGEHGLLWTPVRISGTLRHPEEDLSPRLIAAAGLRMFERIPESGGTILKFSDAVLGGDSAEKLRRSLEVIEKGEDIAREARDLLKGGSLLDTILGPSKPKEDQEK